jgi:crossover junction endodeoxyribonuclease RuvC
MPSLLCLDLGTKTGFALLRADGRIESGTQRFDLKTNEGQGMRYVKFRRWLIETKQAHGELVRIAYEQVMGHGAYQVIAAHVYGGMLATLQAFCEHHQIAYEGVGVTTIKKRFTGSGKAQKVDVINQCKALGFSPGSDNEADAIALLHVVTGTCPVLTMNGATPKKRTPKPAPAMTADVDPF